MKRFLKACMIVAFNLFVFMALLAAIELYYRNSHPVLVA
jgi:hypothetical protein